MDDAWLLARQAAAALERLHHHANLLNMPPAEDLLVTLRADAAHRAERWERTDTIAPGRPATGAG